MKSPTRWIVEITTSDMPEETFLMLAVDAHTHLPVAAAGTRSTVDDFVTELDRTGMQIGYPEEINIDPGFEFSMPTLKKWGTQLGIKIVYGPLSHRTMT